MHILGEPFTHTRRCARYLLDDTFLEDKLAFPCAPLSGMPFAVVWGLVQFFLRYVGYSRR